MELFLQLLILYCIFFNMRSLKILNLKQLILWNRCIYLIQFRLLFMMIIILFLTLLLILKTIFFVTYVQKNEINKLSWFQFIQKMFLVVICLHIRLWRYLIQDSILLDTFYIQYNPNQYQLKIQFFQLQKKQQVFTIYNLQDKNNNLTYFSYKTLKLKIQKQKHPFYKDPHQMNKEKCSKCHHVADYFYKCQCKPIMKMCRDCSVMKSFKCIICNKKYQIMPKVETRDNKSVKINKPGLSTTSKTQNKYYYLQEKQLPFSKNQINLYKQSPILPKKQQKKYDKSKHQIKYLQQRRQMVDNYFHKAYRDQYSNIQSIQKNQRSYQNSYLQRSIQSRHIFQTGNKTRQYERQKKFQQQISGKYSYPSNKPISQNSISYQKNSYENNHKKNQNEKLSNNSANTFQNKSYVSNINLNDNRIKQKPKQLTKQQQLKQIIRSLQKNKGYLDIKCNKIYQLYQLAQQIDKTNPYKSMISLPDCKCTQNKQFILNLLKDRCLICAKQSKLQSQKYQLKNGFCICTNCQVFIEQKDQTIKNYIKSLFYQCLNCEYNQVKRTKKQMNLTQNKNQPPICKFCYQLSLNKLKRFQQHKEFQKTMQQEKIKRQQQNRKREEQILRHNLENQRKRQEIQRNNKAIFDRIQQYYLKIDLQMINQMQQRQKRLQQQKQRQKQIEKIKKQNEQKRNKMLQDANNRKQKQQRMNQIIENRKIQNERQKKQNQTRKVYQSQGKNSYQSRKCIVCYRTLTHSQKGTEIDGTILCSTCSSLNKSQYLYKNAAKSSIMNYNIQKPQNVNKMMTEDQRLQNKKKEFIVQNSRLKNIYEYNPQPQKFNYLNRNTLNKQGKNEKVNNFITNNRSNHNQYQKEQMINRDSKNKINNNSPIKQKTQKQNNLISPFQLLNNGYKINTQNQVQFITKQDTFSKFNQQKISISRVRLQQPQSSQKLSKQSNQKQYQGSGKLTCGICYNFIDSIEKLGVKNEDGLILCKQCYQNQKQGIQNKESIIGRYSQQNQLESDYERKQPVEIQNQEKDKDINQNDDLKIFNKDKTTKFQDNLIFNKQQHSQTSENTQQILSKKNFIEEKRFDQISQQQSNLNQNYKLQRKQNRTKINNQSSTPNAFDRSSLNNRGQTLIANNNLQQQTKNSNKHLNSRVQSNDQPGKPNPLKYIEKQPQQNFNFDQGAPQQSVSISPLLKSDSIFSKREQVSLSEIKINQYKKLTQKLNSQKQLAEKSSNELSKKQQSLLNQSLNRSNIKPERDNSSSIQSQHSETIQSKQKIEQKQKIPFDAGVSEIPKKNNQFIYDQREIFQNPLQNTQIQIHKMLIEQSQQINFNEEKQFLTNKIQDKKQKINSSDEQIDIIEENQPILNEKLQVVLENVQNECEIKNLVPCAECQYMILSNKAFCISEDSNVESSDKIYMCLICYSKQFYEAKKAQQMSKRSRLSDSRSKYNSRQKSRVSNRNYSEVKNLSVRKQLQQSYNEGIYPRQDLFLQKPTNQSTIKYSLNDKLLLSTKDMTSIDIDSKKFLQNKLQKSSVFRQNNFMTPQVHQKNATQENIYNKYEKPTQIFEVENKKEVNKEEKKRCEICRRQNSILCFNKICLDCFKKQKLSSSKEYQV